MSKPKRILVVDDSPMTLDLTRAALEDAGFVVVCASRLRDLDEAMAEPPDLVLMDVQMPEAYGDELGSMLRGTRLVEAPILLYSTLDDDELERRARDAAVDGWISKNDGAEVMVERVRAVLADVSPGQ